MYRHLYGAFVLIFLIVEGSQNSKHCAEYVDDSGNLSNACQNSVNNL